jgi:hypothetical protein
MGAKDWRTRLALSLTHSGRYHFIEYHHIFPKAALKGRYEKSEINEMANMAFVSGGANRRMGSTPAERTLAEVRDEQGDQVLVDHCVPLDPPRCSVAPLVRAPTAWDFIKDQTPGGHGSLTASLGSRQQIERLTFASDAMIEGDSMRNLKIPRTDIFFDEPRNRNAVRR